MSWSWSGVSVLPGSARNVEGAGVYSLFGGISQILDVVDGCCPWLFEVIFMEVCFDLCELFR